MKVIIKAKKEAEVVAPAAKGTKLAPKKMIASLRQRSEQCVNHLCGCNCGC
jgi:hypothetical protein